MKEDSRQMVTFRNAALLGNHGTPTNGDHHESDYHDATHKQAPAYCTNTNGDHHDTSRRAGGNNMDANHTAFLSNTPYASSHNTTLSHTMNSSHGGST